MIGVVAAGMPVAWLIARAAGLVAFALLTVSVTLGLMMSTRLLKPKRQKDLLGWHQTLIWMGLSMLVLHGGRHPPRPGDALRADRRGRPRNGTVAADHGGGRRRRRLSDARARPVLPRAASHRPAPVASSPLRVVRRLRPRARPRAPRGHRPAGEPPAWSSARSRSCTDSLAHLRAHPHAAPRAPRPATEPAGRRGRCAAHAEREPTPEKALPA